MVDETNSSAKYDAKHISHLLMIDQSALEFFLPKRERDTAKMIDK